ncbi:MAG TPA: sulfotransferase domain-containing protein, partial [Terriglobales bacterium]|nr:sulfotransferase domain-containing protein [Terriglobales bacterium]
PLSSEQLLILRFEDLRKDPLVTLVQIAHFLGVSPDDTRIRRAIANNTLEKMRVKEKETPQRASARGRFIRSGSVGGWRTTLNEAQLQLFQQHAAEALERLKYPKSAQFVDAVTA